MTDRVPADVAKDLLETLARLKLAREIGDVTETRVSEKRLNWLIEMRIQRTQEHDTP